MVERKGLSGVCSSLQSRATVSGGVATVWLLKTACLIVGINTQWQTASEALSAQIAGSEIKILKDHYKPLAVQAI